MAPAKKKIKARSGPHDDIWLLDPKTTAIVKSQVDDENLVRARRAQFVRNAVTIFCRKGYHTTTIKEIAAEAGVSPGLIYQYITDKSDILFLAFQFIKHNLKQGLPEAISQGRTPIEKYMAAYDAYCRVIDANREACMLVHRELITLSEEHLAIVKELELETNGLITDCITDCIAAGHFRNLDATLFTYNTVMIAHTWAISYDGLSQITTLDNYITVNLENLLYSATTDTGRKLIGEWLGNRREQMAENCYSKTPVTVS